MTKKYHQEPFTAFPNHYTDYVKPRLTGTQRDVCDVAIRLTKGYQKSNARIPNSTFIKKSGRSDRAIRYAKDDLQKMGILIVIEQATGYRAALYAIKFDSINWDYKQPEARASEADFIQEDIADHEEDKQPEARASEADFIQEDIAHKSMPASSDKPDRMATNATFRVATNATPYSNSTPDPDLKEKQTKEKDVKSNDLQKEIRTVRYEFLNSFPEAKAEDDWKFFSGVIKDYGLEACMYQLNYMKEHRKKHPIANPKGFFKCSLEKNYQIPAFITAKIKADERADFAIEHGNKLRKEREQWQKEAVDFNTGQDAIKNIIAMLGQRESEAVI